MPEKIRKSHPDFSPDSGPKIAIIIVAAGSGTRAGGDIPKQFQMLAGQPVLRRTLNCFLQNFPGDHIQCVISPDYQTPYLDVARDLSLRAPVFGGDTRQASVHNGLIALAELEPDFVLVHDAARPFVPAALIDNIIERLYNGAKGVIPGIKVTDTIKQASNGVVTGTVPRDGLYAVQTPQGFDYATLLSAHKRFAARNFTDDAAVMEADGVPIEISTGNPDNFKITTPSDFIKAEQMILSTLPDVRSGSGYDVHRFEPGENVVLCGIKIPFSSKLKGHSDADVGMHALTDAILSAVSAGDIGTHFPPSDPQWKGAPSDTFLRFASDLVSARGGIISHLGVTLICEAPKIGPHKDAMRTRLSEITGVDTGRISVQATTTEKLGFTGRGEGIAAQAIATVRLPLEAPRNSADPID